MNNLFRIIRKGFFKLFLTKTDYYHLNFLVEIEVIKHTAIKLCVTLWPLGTLDFTQNGTASTIEIEDCSKFPNGCCQDLNKNHLPAPGPNQAGCPTHCQCNPLGIVLSPFFHIFAPHTLDKKNIGILFPKSIPKFYQFVIQSNLKNLLNVDFDQKPN